MDIVARELAPARRRSRRKSCNLVVPGTTRRMALGPLRDPVGASSLATKATLALLGQRAAFELDDALTVMLDRLGGQYAALVVLQFAVQLL